MTRYAAIHKPVLALGACVVMIVEEAERRIKGFPGCRKSS
jgi:hypothetical protein